MIRLETLSSYRGLSALNESLIKKAEAAAKPKKTEGKEETKEEKKTNDKPVAPKRKINLGKGTNQFYSEIEEKFTLTLKDQLLSDENLRIFNEEFFTQYKFDELFDRIITA